MLRVVGCLEEDAWARIAAFLAHPRHFLVDIRAKPWLTRSPEWNRSTLAQTYKRQYVHLPGLGNVFPKGKGVRLAHPDGHVRDLAQKLEQGYSYLLLCGSKIHRGCHCEQIVALLRHQVDRQAGVSFPIVLNQGELWNVETP